MGISFVLKWVAQSPQHTTHAILRPHSSIPVHHDELLLSPLSW